MPENLGVVSDYEPASELSRSTQPWVAPSNVEQLAVWDGDAGAYWAACANRFNEGVAGYREQFVAAAAIDATAKVGSTTCEPAWEITRPNTACTTTRQPGSSRRDVADPVSRGAAHRSGRPGAQDERHSCSILNFSETSSPTNAGTR
jgi:hypothetical protein